MNRCLVDQFTPQPLQSKPFRCQPQRLYDVGLPRLVASRVLATALALAGFCSAAAAQGFQRQFPPAAKRAVLQVTAPPEVLLNGAPARLSPGARIHGLTNTLVMSGQMVGQRLVVNYVRDTQGMIHQVWILSETEAQQKRPGTEPSTNFTFGSDAIKPGATRGTGGTGSTAPYSPSPN